MNRRITVYADTNVLYPYLVSDLLLWLASDGVIRLVWTQYLVDEVVDVVPRRRRSRGVGRDERAVRSQWTAACAHLRSDEVSEAQWRSMLGLATGPDPDDHPHQAAAIYARADYLLTDDSRGFPAEPLLAMGITVAAVDDFLCTILAQQPDEVICTVQSRSKSLTRPPMTLERYLDYVALPAPRFAELVALATNSVPYRGWRLPARLRRLILRREPVD